MSRTLRIAAVLALTLAAVFAAACGDEDEDTATVTTTVTEESGTPDAEDAETTDTDDPSDDESAAPEDEDSEPAEVVALKRFRSPTGNIACALSRNEVRCDIAEKTWTAPRPEGCPNFSDFGHGLTLNADGVARVVCAGDTVLDPSAPVLDYGSVSRVGAITCESDESGVECSSDTGGEFSLSREEYDLG